MPRAQKAKTKTRSRRQLITPASRARITRMVCAGTCRRCRAFPPDCDCGHFQPVHSYQGTRRGINIQIYLAVAANRDGHRIRYRVHFPALRRKPGAGRRPRAEDLTGTAGTVFDVIERIEQKYERRELLT